MQDIYYHLSRVLGISLEITDSNLIPYSSSKNTGCFCGILQSNPEYADLAAMCHQCRKKLLRQCQKSGELVWDVCHCGLFYAMMPILSGVNEVAFLSLGPFRTDGSQLPEATNEESIKKLYEDLLYFSEKKLNSLKHILANLNFSVKFQTDNDDTLITQITNYIRTNLQGDLRLSNLCETFHVSKNHLYKIFDENFNTTVNEYIIQERLKVAKILLQANENDVCVIADKLGFKNTSYFSNFFKKYTGMSPRQYRNQNR